MSIQKRIEMLANQVRNLEYPRSHRVAWLRRVALLVVLSSAAFVIWWLFFHQSSVNKGLRALQAAYSESRTLESRLSGFTYAPFATFRGPAQRTNKYGELWGRLLLEAVTETPSTETHHAVGCYLLTERNYDQAIYQFEEALRINPQDARLHSDLGAALFEKGSGEEWDDEGGRNVEAFAQGLAHLNRALELDSNLHEAMFNRALLHEKMMLTGLAAEDWRVYLGQDLDSAWASEAHHHLATLEERGREVTQSKETLVEDFLSALRNGDASRAWALFGPYREMLITKLLVTYLDEVVRPGGASEPLNALASVGKSELARTGDRYTLDVARFYRLLPRKQFATAREGLTLMVDAQNAYSDAQVARAAELRDRARRLFTGLGDKCSAELATYWLALHYWELGRTHESKSLFDPLLRECTAAHHLWLRVRSQHQRAGVEFKFGEYSTAIAREDEARKIAEKLNDPSICSSARSAVIEHYRMLGNREACLNQMAEGWHLVGTATLTPTAGWRLYDTLAGAFYTFGYCDAAIDYDREALEYARVRGDFVTVSSCQVQLGLFFCKGRRFEDALEIIRTAYEAGKSREDETLGKLVMALAAVQIGNVYRAQGEFVKALDSYDQAVDLHKRYTLDFPTHLYQAYKGRLACYIKIDDLAAAQLQLATLLPLMDQHRAKIREEDNRESFFDAEQTVYDMAIDLACLQSDDPRIGFERVEASRARSLLDSIQGGADIVSRDTRAVRRPKAIVQPSPLDLVQARIPASARLLEYAVLEDKVVIWVVSREEIKLVVSPVSQSSLNDKITNYLTELKGSSPGNLEVASRLAHELYDYLLAPIQQFLGESNTLFIVPDKVLNHLPWDALVSPASRYIVEDYMVVESPSATMFARCTDLASQKKGERAERAIVVGNPSFDRTEFPTLDPLPDAKTEAEEAAAVYSCVPLIGPAAREQVVRNELERADVAHFALHCVVDERSPTRSCLLLAKEPKGFEKMSSADGRLQASEICELGLPRLRLAVLSACRSGVERYYRGEGMIGMARAFLVARVPVVVASLWSVESAAAAELMIQLHRNRIHGLITAEALWRAKRAMLQSSVERYRLPFCWAAFQMIGGQAEF